MNENVLVHVGRNADICIYENDGQLLKGSFFKKKPTIGSLFMSWTIRNKGNNLHLFEVVNIVENRDAKVNSTTNYDPKMAYFVLDIKNVSGDTKYKHIDTSVMNNI
jgi:hypothetical protein